MAQSLIRLSVESNQYEQKLRGAKRQFEDFTASIGINMKKMTAYGIAVGAAATAINSLTGKISEAISEGGRMAKEMEGVRNAFNRLNQPGLLDNLREATHGTVTDLELMKQAVKFDNFNLSLDQMGTMLAFAQQQAKDTGQDVGYLVDSIVTGLGRKSLPILDNLGLSATDIKDRMKETGDMTKAVADIIQERMEKAGGYIETAADRAAKADTDMKNAMEQLGETFGPLESTGAAMWQSLELGAIKLLNKGLKPLIQAFTTLGQVQKIQQNMNGGGMMDRFAANLRGSKNQDSLYSRQMAEINRAINVAQANLQKAEKGGMGSIQLYRNRLDALVGVKQQYEEVAKSIMSPKTKDVTSDIITPTTTKGSSKSSAPGFGDFYKQMQKSIIDPESLKAAENFIPVSESIRNAITGCSDAMADYSAETANWTKNFDPYIDYLNKAAKKQQQLANAQQLGAQAAQNFGAAMAGLEDPAARAAGTIIQAIASIALGFAQAAAAKDTTASGWAWLGWLAAGTAAMATTIATVHSLTGYAEGGIVKGNSYSGDNVYAGGAMVNAGELVLNTAQQRNLADSIQNNSRPIQVTGRLRGRDIFFSADRYAQTSGRGQLLTFG